MADQLLRLIITGDASAATKEMRKLQRDLTKVSNNLASVGSSMTRFVTVPLAAAGAAAVKMAMDAEESENLFSVSLGKMEKSARAWSEEFSDAVGANSYAVRKMLGTFQVMVKNFGISEKSALGMSEAMTKLAYDMASFYNISTDEAFQKLQAGLTGEIEPLKRLGIVINETAVEQYALANGMVKTTKSSAKLQKAAVDVDKATRAYSETLKEHGKNSLEAREAKAQLALAEERYKAAAAGSKVELTEAQKVQARYGLILKQTSAAQGDLERTSDSSTNKIRRLKEQTTELAITYGQLLIPVLDKLVSLGNQMASWLDGLNAEQKNMVVNVALVAAAIGPLLIALSKVVLAIRAVIGVYSQVAAAATKSAATQVAANEAVAASATKAGAAAKAAGGAAAASKSGWLVGAGGIAAMAAKAAILLGFIVAVTYQLNRLAKNPNLGKLGVNGNTSRTVSPSTPSRSTDSMRSNEYATGGIASGPTTGYPATLHGEEMVVPLAPRYRSRARDLTAQLLDRLGSAQAAPVFNISGSRMDAEAIRIVVRQELNSAF